GEQVQIPGRVLGRSPERSDDDVPPRLHEVEQRERAPLAALPAGRGEQQNGCRLADAAKEPAAAGPVENDVERRDELQEPPGQRTTSSPSWPAASLSMSSGAPSSPWSSSCSDPCSPCPDLLGSGVKTVSSDAVLPTAHHARARSR